MEPQETIAEAQGESEQERTCPKTGIRIAVLAAAMLGLAFLSRMTFSDSGIQSLLVSLPLLTFIGAMLKGNLLAFSVHPLLFIFWSYNLIQGRKELPIRSVFLAVIIAVLSGTWFAMGYSYGIRYQGVFLTTCWAIFSLAFAISLLIWSRNLHRKSSWLTTLAFHWLLFVWIVWCAFPYLGELP